MSTDAAILAALWEAGDGAVSGAELSQRLGLTRAAIWARIEELRRLGYEIEARPHVGYRLRHAPDLLHADDLLARLGRTRVVGRDIRVFKTTTSTNDVAEKLARDGVPEGVVVFAEAQTQGRGRLGRRWASPAGKGLWFSVLLRPKLHPTETTQLTILAATALRRAICGQVGLALEIKWPNDLAIRGRKVAGILTELSAELDRVRHVILGIGVDVNLNPGDFPSELAGVATSLKAELGRAVCRPTLATAILRELDADYARLRDGRFAELAEEWAQHCSTLGRRVTIQVGHRTVSGRAEALDEQGALLLRTEHGHLERVIGGDVTLER